MSVSERYSSSPEPSESGRDSISPGPMASPAPDVDMDEDATIATSSAGAGTPSPPACTPGADRDRSETPGSVLSDNDERTDAGGADDSDSDMERAPRTGSVTPTPGPDPTLKGLHRASSSEADILEDSNPNASHSKEIIEEEPASDPSATTSTNASTSQPQAGPSTTSTPLPSSLPPRPATIVDFDDEDSEMDFWDLPGMGSTVAEPMVHSTSKGGNSSPGGRGTLAERKAAELAQAQLNASNPRFKKKRPNKKNRRGGVGKLKSKSGSQPPSGSGDEMPPPPAPRAPLTVQNLPFELIGEISTYLRSGDLLALARTSQWFCRTLVAEGASWMWRGARARCGVSSMGMPDPNEVLALDEPPVASTSTSTSAAAPNIAGGAEDGVEEDVEGSDTGSVEAVIGLLPELVPKKKSKNKNKAKPRKEYWKEWAFAAFVLDPGPCSICDTPTNLPYVSYALRFRRCGRPECKDSMKGLSRLRPELNFQGHQILRKALPHMGDRRSTYNQYYWKEDYDNEIKRYYAVKRDETKVADLLKEWSERARHVNKLLELDRQLIDWRSRWDTALYRVRNANDNAWKKLAVQKKVEKGDMVNSVTLQRVLHDSAYAVTKVSDEAWQKHTDDILKETQILTLNRLRREDERRQQTQRTQMEVFYKWLRLQSEPGAPVAGRETPSSATVISAESSATQVPVSVGIPFLPPLSEFRQLAVIKLLVSNKEVSEHLKLQQAMYDRTGVVGTMVRAEIVQWVDAAKVKLGALIKAGPLGAVASTSIASAFVAPGGKPEFPSAQRRDEVYKDLVDRPSALFACALCEAFSDKYMPSSSGEGLWRALSFGEVLQHECKGAWARGGVLWAVDHFKPDWPAVHAIREVLKKANIDESLVDVHAKMEDIERRVKCTECVGQVIVPLKDVVRHARRHEVFRCTITPSPQTSILTKTTRRLIRGDAKGAAPKSKADRPVAVIHKAASVKKYGCKHCPGSKQHLSFNGLRSHLKAKHDFDHIGDEDFFVRTDKKPAEPKKRVVEVSGE